LACADNLKLVLTHIRHAATGGTERVFDQLARRWVSAGHQVTVLCRSFQPAAEQQTGATFVRLRSTAVGAAHRHWAFARDVERWVEREGRDHDAVLGLGRTWTQDVLRLGGGCHATFVEGLSWRERLRPKHRLLLALERKVLTGRNTRFFVTNAGMVKDDICERFHLDPERVHVIYNGVDLERFHPGRLESDGVRVRVELGISPDAPVVLFLGTGYARKGLARVLRAFAQVVRTRPEAQLVVVGHDSGQGRFEAMARRLGIAAVTHFVGRRTDPEAWYGAADVYTLPTHYDPFANSTLEALACGVPVVTTRTNGGAELIDDGVQGTVLAAPDDPDCVAQAVSSWLDHERGAQGRRAARLRAQEHPIQDKLVQLEELLRRCAAVH